MCCCCVAETAPIRVRSGWSTLWQSLGGSRGRQHGDGMHTFCSVCLPLAFEPNEFGHRDLSSYTPSNKEVSSACAPPHLVLAVLGQLTRQNTPLSQRNCTSSAPFFMETNLWPWQAIARPSTSLDSSPSTSCAVGGGFVNHLCCNPSRLIARVNQG